MFKETVGVQSSQSTKRWSLKYEVSFTPMIALIMKSNVEFRNSHDKLKCEVKVHKMKKWLRSDVSIPQEVDFRSSVVPQ